MAIVTVKYRNQVEALRDVILKKRGKGFYVTNLTFKDDGSVLVSLLAQAVNRQYPYLYIYDEAMVLTTEGWARPVKRYCEDILNVEVESEASICNLDREIYKVGKGIDTKFVMESNNGLYYDIITKEEYPAFSINKSPGLWDKKSCELMPDIIVYNQISQGGMTCTNGQLKKKNITLLANNLDHINVNEIWNAVTYGSANILCDGSKVTPKDIAQANSRLSAFRAPSAPVAVINNYVVLMDKVTFQGKEGGDEYNDGFGLLSCEFLGAAFSKLEPDRYQFTDVCTLGTAVQLRALMNKLMASTVRRSYIREFVDHTARPVYVLEKGKMSQDDIDNFILGVKSKGKKGKFAKAFVVICNNKEVQRDYDLLTDLNGLKAPFNPEEDSAIEILDISHADYHIETGSRTSTQMLQTMMVADPEKTMQVIERLAEEEISRRHDALYNNEGTAPSWTDLQGNYDRQQLLSKIAPTFARECYAPLWHTLVDKTIKGYCTAIRRLNIPTAGGYAKIVMDSAADFGQRLLGMSKEGEVEIIAPLAERAGVSQLVGIKYPKQGIFEYLKGHVISKRDYVEQRVKTNIHLSDKQKHVISEYVMNLSDGVIMIPAIEALKKMLAGLDRDGDAIQMFFDQDIVDIFWQVQPAAVVYDENDVTIHDYEEEALG